MDQYRNRIAVVCFSASLGGLELTSRHLAQALQKKGVPATLVLPPSSPLEERARAAGVETAAVEPGLKYFDIRTAVRLFRLIRRERIDVLLFMRSEDIHIGSLITVFRPSVSLVFYQQMQSGHDKRDVLHTWIYSKLSLWISLTQRMKDNVLRFTRMPADKVTVLPLGTDMERFDPTRYDRAEARRHFGLPPEMRIVGVLGRLDPGKGQDVLIRTLPVVAAKHPDVLYVIAGDETAGEPGHKKRLEDLCRRLGIERHVRFMPFTNDVPLLMTAFDVFTLPSFSETFGLVVVEAMAMEKPVIATNAGGVPEIIADGTTGLLVEARDEHSLAAAILRVLGDEALARSLARKGREDALRRFDFTDCVDTLIDELSHRMLLQPSQE